MPFSILFSDRCALALGVLGALAAALPSLAADADAGAVPASAADASSGTKPSAPPHALTAPTRPPADSRAGSDAGPGAPVEHAPSRAASSTSEPEKTPAATRPPRTEAGPGPSTGAGDKSVLDKAPTEKAQSEPPQPTPPPPSAAELLARSEFDAAQRDYDLGRFDSAVAHYAKAYEAMPLPALLFNIGQCHRHMRQFDKAAFFYRRYLDLAGTPQNAELTRELLGEMEQRQKEKVTFERDLARNAALALTPNGDVAAVNEAPLHRRWWFWAAVGGVVAAGATAIAVHALQPPDPTLGTVIAR